VENIPLSVTESDLWVMKIGFLTQVHEANTEQEIFSTIGHVRRVQYTPADQSAFIAYDHISDAQTAVTLFNNGLLRGQNIRVFLRDNPVQPVAKKTKLPPSAHSAPEIRAIARSNPFSFGRDRRQTSPSRLEKKVHTPPSKSLTGHPPYGFDFKHESRDLTYGSTESKRPGYEAWLAPGEIVSIPTKMTSSSPFYSAKREEYEASRGDKNFDDSYGSDDYDEYW
jgi:RNA recognition motif-containing protein